MKNKKASGESPEYLFNKKQVRIKFQRNTNASDPNWKPDWKPEKDLTAMAEKHRPRNILGIN